MYLARRVSLNGIFLDDLDSRIVISSIETADGKENITAVNNGGIYGQRVTGDRRSTLDVIVKFRMLGYGRSTLGMQARAELLEKINAWARVGGYLYVNYKPNRRLYVRLAQAPGEGSLWDFSKEFQMTFRAYEIPYWEEVLGHDARTGSSTNASVGITVDGSAKTQINVVLLNVSGMTINAVQINISGQIMYLNELELRGSEVLHIDHTPDGLIRIRIRAVNGTYRSVMNKRSTASVDDFVLSPGNHNCIFGATRACTMTVSWRARYL